MTHEDEYRDCPFEVFGRDTLKDLKTDVKELEIHIQGLEIDRAGEKVQLANIVEDIGEIKNQQSTIINLLTAYRDHKATPLPPVDTFKAVVYDIGIWTIKIGIFSGFAIFLLNQMKGI